jgi:hypothetical protein
MLDDWLETIRALPWRDWTSTVIAGVLALFGIYYTAQSRGREARQQREFDNAKIAHDDDMKRRAHDQTVDLNQTQDLTARFRALMDGYEARIKDLSAELVATKLELRELQARLERPHAPS